MTVLSLAGKVALVAGGTSGIGLAVARTFASAGAVTTIGGRRDCGVEVAAAAQCSFIHLDVADESSVQAALAAVAERDGKLDVLVLNAGVAQPPGPLAKLDSGAAEAVVRTNLLGSFYGLKHASPYMNDGGSIVLTSSISAISGSPFEGLYGATKAGVSSLARSAAVDLGPRGIRVNAVQPGAVWTDMNPMPEAWFEVLAPLGRKGTVDDLVGMYLFLASDASRYLTGQAITVDGGSTLGMSRALMKLLATAATSAPDPAPVAGAQSPAAAASPADVARVATAPHD
jgi:NAD(P)-dependent dehydrogenase (short-subunit alcohol dehydrogenase family)